MRGMLKAFGMAPPVLALVLLLGGGVATAATEQMRLHAQRVEQHLFVLEEREVRLPGRLRAEGLRREARSADEEGDRRRDQEGGRGRSQAQGEHRRARPGPSAPRCETRRRRRQREAGAGRPKLSAAQTKQLAKLLDSYLKAHPEARGKNAEELRNELSVRPQLTFAAGAAASSSRFAACAGAGAGLPSRSAMICARAA